MLFTGGVEMKPVFTKQVTLHSPSNGWMAICQRVSRFIGIVGVKF
jgi:hypothetical protein